MPSVETTIPASSRPQHLEALDRANDVRLARASLKRSVRGGRLAAAEVVRGCPWEARTMTVGELLRSQQRWGLTRSRKFLSELELNENRTLEKLTERQRDVVARELELRARSRRRGAASAETSAAAPQRELQAA